MSLQLAPRCCCCPSKIEVGLPDSLQVNFSINSSNSTGMPADEDHGACGDDGHAWTRWQHSDALIELLQNIIFDYQGDNLGGCPDANCCFFYSSRNEYVHDPYDELGCGSPYNEEMYYLGNPIFPEQRLFEDGWVDQRAAGDPREGDSPCYSCPPPPPVNCCDGCVDCSLCGDFEGWSGTKWIPLPVIANAGMWICVEGEIVTICGNIRIYTSSIQKVGTYTRAGAVAGGADCAIIPAEVTDDTIETCHVGYVDLFFTMVGDLTYTSGVTMWEKIKNYTEWDFSYEYATCGPPAGCGGIGESCVGRCTQTCNCTCVFLCEGDDGAITNYPADSPHDQICYYSVGELNMEFADA